MKNWPDKDPDELLDYAIDWRQRLAQPTGASDRLDSAEWIVPAGLTEVRSEISGGMSIVWLSGGTLGVTYTVTCRVTTVGGRVMDQSARLRIRAK